MMSDNQTQKAGNNSRQIQAQSIIINNGIEEKRAREIFHEMFDIARKDLTQEANEIAQNRVERFERDLMPKIEKVKGAINSFGDPAFQFALVNAHKAAAASNREADLELLSELLLHRIKRKDNKNSCAGIGKAIEIVDDISDEALLGLTVGFAVEKYVPVTGNISEGLSILDDLFGKFGVDELPIGMEWLDHLDILNAVRVSTISHLKKYEQWMCENIPGYFVEGIRIESEEYKQVLSMLKDNKIPCQILCNHELNEGFVRLAVTSKESIDNICLVCNANVNGQEQKIESNLSEQQKEVLHNIYGMCNNEKGKQQIINSFSIKVDEYRNLKKVKQWWNAVPYAFQITTVGKTLAHSNAKRIDINLPDMD